MSVTNSPVAAPPRKASNMSDSQSQQRLPTGAPMTHLPPTPGAECVFFTCRGERKTREEMRIILDQLRTACTQGKLVPSGHQHEVLWMIQQHYPDHPCLGGRQYPPPPGTLPQLMHLGQRQGPPTQRPPQASSPNMIPSGTARSSNSGVQHPHGMVIDPALANSYVARQQNAMLPMQMRPPPSTPSQGPAPFVPVATSFTRSPKQAPSPAMSGTPSAMSFTPGRPAAFVFQSDQAIRSPSKTSPFRPGQVQYSPPLTPGRPSFSPATGGAKPPHQQIPVAPQNGYTTSPVLSRGILAAPPSQPASAQTQNGQVGCSNRPNLQAPEVRAKIDARMAEDLQKFNHQQAAQYREKMGNDYNLKWRFIHWVGEMQRQAYERRLQKPPSMTAGLPVGPQHTVTGPAGNKRKKPHTVVEQPKSKRPAIDLTIDDPPSVSPPSGPLKNLPIPTHLIPRPANADAYEHALQHGVYLPDLHLPLYSKEEVKLATLVHQQCIRKAHSDLDPVPQELKKLVQASKAATQTKTPGTGAATVGDDARSAQLGQNTAENAASRNASPSCEQSPMPAEYSVGEIMSSRSPEVFMENMSEQRANLEYELNILGGTEICV